MKHTANESDEKYGNLQHFISYSGRIMDRIVAAQVYVAITEQGSLVGAARLLDMSRAMVTRYLAQMEQWSGARLLHRTTRKLSLTAAGEATLLRCRELLQLCEQMPLAADAQADQPRGMLRIACSQSLAQSVLAAAVAQFTQRYPLTQIDLQIGNTNVNLVEERIDLAIRVTNQLDPNLIARRLGSCASVVCASPAYLAAHGTPAHASELTSHNCLTYRYFGKSLWEFESLSDGLPLAVPVSGSISANESVVLMQAALAGAGITLQPVWSVSALIESGELVAVLPQLRPKEMGVYGVYGSRRQMGVTLREMVGFLGEWFGSEARI